MTPCLRYFTSVAAVCLDWHSLRTMHLQENNSYDMKAYDFPPWRSATARDRETAVATRRCSGHLIDVLASCAANSRSGHLLNMNLSVPLLAHARVSLETHLFSTLNAALVCSQWLDGLHYCCGSQAAHPAYGLHKV